MRILWLLALVFPLRLFAAAGDAEFLDARDAVQRGQWQRVTELVPSLREHPLYPYVELWQLKARLNEFPRDDVRQYLERYSGQLVANRLRADWLRVLAKAQQWNAFEQDWNALVDPDTDLQCLQLQAAVRRDNRVLEANKARWFAGRDLPESCSSVFEAMFTSGVLKDADILARARLAFMAGNTTLGKAMLQRASAWSAADAKRLDSAIRNPDRYLSDKRLGTRTRAEREVALFALSRVASNFPENAASSWQRLSGSFSRDDREAGWGLIAVAAARRHSAQALDWFRKAADTRLDASQLEWRARAALREQNWEEVLRSIESMEPEYRDRAVWRYWKARSLRRLGREPEAMPILAVLAGEHHFHAQLASEELGPSVGPAPTYYKPSEDDVRNASRIPGIARALAWYRLGMRYEGNLEWIWTVRDLDDVSLLGAAELARREGWYERAIATADKTRKLTNLELRYPTPFQEQLRARAREFEVDDAWLYGLIRQESRFNAAARSGVGASGLMQIMPDTARWVARKLGLKDWRSAIDNTPDANISFGTFYLKHVLVQLDGSPVLASAAYNAGPRRAQVWRAAAPMEGAIYIDTIPFLETREYVRKVMANAVQYARLFGRQMETLTERIGTVPARSPGSDGGS